MMRPLLTLSLCGALAVPGAGLAQALQAPPAATPTPQAPLLLDPFPTVAETTAAPNPIESKPDPAPQEAAAPGPKLASPTTVVPVLVTSEEKKDSGAGAKVGQVIGGVALGAAGAAVAGPVGKFAGGFVGKRIAKGIFGDGKDKNPQVTTIARSPETAAQFAAAGAPVPAEVAEAAPDEPAMP